jgi:hypothetical protein
MLVNTFFENKVDQLFGVAGRLDAALSRANIEYRITGGFAAFIHVNDIDPMAARLTRDIDVEVRHDELDAVIEATRALGFRHIVVKGLDVLVDAAAPRAHSEIHLYPVQALSPLVRHESGVSLVSVSDLVVKKLTTFRLKDRVHVRDLDGAGLITPDIEAQLSPELKSHLDEVRATE